MTMAGNVSVLLSDSLKEVLVGTLYAKFEIQSSNSLQPVPAICS